MKFWEKEGICYEKGQHYNFSGADSQSSTVPGMYQYRICENGSSKNADFKRSGYRALFSVRSV